MSSFFTPVAPSTQAEISGNEQDDDDKADDVNDLIHDLTPRVVTKWIARRTDRRLTQTAPE